MTGLQVPFWLEALAFVVVAFLFMTLAFLLVFLAACTAIFTITGHMRLTGSLKREESFSFRQVVSDAFDTGLGYTFQIAVIWVPFSLVTMIVAYVVAMLKISS